MGWRKVAKCYVQSVRQYYEFEIFDVSNGQNTVARLLTLSPKNFKAYRVIRWRAIDNVGIACGCDKNGENNKCVVVFGRAVVEKEGVKPYTSSTANISDECDNTGKEAAVKLRDIKQFIMEE